MTLSTITNTEIIQTVTPSNIVAWMYQTYPQLALVTDLKPTDVLMWQGKNIDFKCNIEGILACIPSWLTRYLAYHQLDSISSIDLKKVFDTYDQRYADEDYDVKADPIYCDLNIIMDFLVITSDDVDLVFFYFLFADYSEKNHSITDMWGESFFLFKLR